MKQSSLKGKTILLVHAGTASKWFIPKKLKQLGLRVIILHKEKVAELSDVADGWIIANLNNHTESVRAVAEYQKNHPNSIDGAVTFWDEAVLLTSKITDTFHWIGIPYTVADTAKNKHLFRSFCEAQGIPSPKHTTLKSKKEIPSIEKKLGNYPFVIKPVYGAASGYVVKVFNRQDFEDTYDYIRNNIKSYWLASEWESLELLVEQYIDGDEVDIDMIVQNGKIKFSTISDNFNKNRDKFFVDSGQAIPSSLPEHEQQLLLEQTEEIVEKLGIVNAIIHAEAKSTKNGVFPIECNLRMGGDYIYSYLKDAWHIDFVEQAANIALGVYIPLFHIEKPYQYIVGWDFQPNVSGILTSLEVDKELKKKPFVHSLHISKEVGDAVMRPPEGYDSIGWITVSGTNTLDAEDNLEEALSHIRYTITEFDTESSLGKTTRDSNLSAAVVKKQQLLKAAKIERVRTADTAQDIRKLHIGIAGNKTHGQRKEHGEGSTVSSHVADILTAGGYQVTEFDFNNVPELLHTLPTASIDLMFNTTEGIGRDATLLPQAAALIEALHIPMTGTSSYNLALCKDKIRVKKLFEYHGIPTPKWDYMNTIDDTVRTDLRYPLIVKPGMADDSFGITHASVVRNKKELHKQAVYIIETLHMPALIEEYVAGEEYEVSIIGNSNDDLQVLPLTKMKTEKNKKLFAIMTEKTSKQISVPHAIAASKKLTEKQSKLLTEIAIDAYKVTRCRDYGYVGIRIDTQGNPLVLEVDPNPPLHDHCDFMVAAKLMNLTYVQTIEKIIAAAVNRYKKSKKHIVWM
jgi:D-alanine-D-alanine ligase